MYDEYRALWAATITQAWSDATGRPVKGQDRVAPTEDDQQKARQWLTEPSTLLALACDMTGVDMGALLHLARERAVSGWQIQ